MNLIEKFILRKVVEKMGDNIFARIFSGKLGWKSLVGALLVPVFVYLTNSGILPADQLEQYVSIAVAVFGIGLRDAISKFTK